MIVRSTFVLFVLGVTATAAFAADPPAASAPQTNQAWTLTYATDARVFSWRGDRGTPATLTPTSGGGSGTEFYMPVAAQLTGRPSADFKLSVLARGGWVWARQSTAGLTGEVATPTDTVVNGTVTYLGWNGWQPFVSLDTNIPTGKSALFGTAALARMDADLVEVASFGEGLNLGPSVGVSLPVTTNLIITASAGYTWRGHFLRESSTSQLDPTVQAATTINPGEVYTGTLGVGYQSDRIAFNVTGSVSDQTTTYENGAPLYKGGRRYLASASFSYTWPDSWGQTTLTGSFAHTTRNKVLFAGMPTLAWETMNTNADLSRAGIQHLFVIGKVAVGPVASYLFRNHNGYDPLTLQFVPEKERWAAGAMARMAVDQSITLNARVEHVWTHANAIPGFANGTQFSVLADAFVPGAIAPAVSSTGWQVALGVNARF